MYSLGGNGAVDVLRTSATGGEHDQVVLLNNEQELHSGFVSGFYEILIGNFTNRDFWVAGSSEADVTVSSLPCTLHDGKFLITVLSQRFRRSRMRV
jgi:hypothetical protein